MVANAELLKIAIADDAAKERIKIAEKESTAKVRILRKEADKFLSMSESSRKKESKQNKEDREEAQEFLKSANQLELEKLDERNKEVSKKAGTTLENEKEKRMKEFDAEEALRERTKEAAFALGNSIFDFRIGKLNAELAAAEGNEQKQNEIRAKLAKAEKQKALFNIAINTASGIVEALPNIALSIIVGAIGTISALKVATTPIPQFAGGVTGFKGGLAELAERGPEMVTESSGKIWMAENRGLYNLSQGASVFPTGSQQTQKALNDKNIVKGLSRIENAVKRQPRQRQESKFDARRAAYWDVYNSKRFN